MIIITIILKYALYVNNNTTYTTRIRYTVLNAGAFKSMSLGYIIQQCFQPMVRDPNLGRDLFFVCFKTNS